MDLLLTEDFLTQVASGLAFFFVALITFIAKFMSDKKDNTEEVVEKVSKTLDLGDAVQALAMELADIRTDINTLTVDNNKLTEENVNFKTRVEELEEISRNKYPAAIKTIKQYQHHHPESIVRIPEIIWDDIAT